jgi:tetratricopeptide (TPR) repeat protein
MTWACWGLANLHAIRGDHDAALSLLDRATAVSGSANLGMWPSFLGWSRGHVYTRMGRIAEGVALLRDALAAHERNGLGVWSSLMTTHLSEACVADGRLDEAQETGARALALARERNERGHEAYALLLLGQVDARLFLRDVEAAESHYRRALMLADGLGMRPLVGRCHLAIGELYGRVDIQAQADEHLAIAATMFREMGFWLARTDAAREALT